jgi:hypothetical protein
VTPDPGDTVTLDLTSGRTLVRGAAWNLLGQAPPMVAVFFIVPLLTQAGIRR